MLNPEEIDEDYIVWCVAYDEYYGYDDETDSQTRAFLRALLADAWDEGYTASAKYEVRIDREWPKVPSPPRNPHRTVKDN